MLVGKVWLFIVFAVLVATAGSSKDASGVDSRTKWQRARRLLWGAPVPPFFAGNKRPTGLPRTATRGNEIQQTLTGDPPGTPPYFVSLFDPDENTPFYSAYKVTPAQAANLGTFGRGAINTRNWRNPQGVAGVNNAYYEAINTDGEPLSKGHMNPLGINTFDKNFMKATFTLTNAVPQFETSNSGPWQAFETRIRNYAQNTCGPLGGTLYLLTGKSNYGLIIGTGGRPVQDLTIPLPYLRENFGGVRLVTPRAIWTAGCCVWAEPGKVFGRLWPAKRAESFAVMSNNQRNAALLHQTEMSVSDLERLLQAPALEEVNLFPGYGNCRLAANNKVLP